MFKHKSMLLIGALLAALLTLPMSAYAFSDVPEDHVAAQSFQLLKELRIFEGYGNDRVGPSDNLTREQFAVIVIRALGKDSLAQSVKGMGTDFSDDDQISDWARGAVNVALSMGIINGYPDGSFRPQNNIKSSEVLAMLVRALGFEKEVVGAWPVGYLIVASTIGLTENLDLDMESFMSRAEMAMVTERALKSRWGYDKDGNFRNFAAEPLLTKVHKQELGDDGEGVLSSVSSSRNEVVIGDIAYKFTENTRLILNTKDVTPNNIGGIANLLADRDGPFYKKPVSIVKASDGTLEKIIATANKDNLLISRVVVDRRDNDLGTIRIDGVAATIEIDPSFTTLVLDGKEASISDLATVMRNLERRYDSPRILARVRTVGDEDIKGNNVYYIEADTKSVLRGKVVSVGADKEGKYFTIQVGGKTEKYYYRNMSLPRVGRTGVFILDHEQVAIHRMNDTEDGIVEGYLWGLVVAVEQGDKKLSLEIATEADRTVVYEDIDEAVVPADLLKFDDLYVIALSIIDGDVQALEAKAIAGWQGSDQAVMGDLFVAGAKSVERVYSQYRVILDEDAANNYVIAGNSVLILDDKGRETGWTLEDLRYDYAKPVKVFYAGNLAQIIIVKE